MTYPAPTSGFRMVPGASSEGALPGRAASVAVVAVDAAGRVLWVNGAFRALAGLGAGDAVAGAPLGRVLPALVPPPAAIMADEVGGSFAGEGGHLHDVSWSRSDAGGWVGTVLPAERRAAGVSAVPLVRRDELTGLADRSSLLSVFRTLLDRGAHGALPIVTACLDLDRFKRVNDSLGHAAGDELLRKVAKRISASVRGSDVVVRMGGDEFAILFAGCTKGEIEQMAARIVDVVARPFIVQGHQVVIGTSIGLATLRPGEADPAEMLRRADVALYRSKSSGRGCLSWFEDGMFAALEERRLLEVDLRRALLLDQFELVYQSQYDFTSGSITGFEALLRWNHPERGQTSPALFIPVAEETGEILKIGAWVLHEACRTAAGWPEELNIAVNVSPVQFESEGFVESIHAALAASGLPPHRLELELTESVLVQEDEMVLARMLALRELGVRLSLDDFGTGYSSLNYLRKYPFTKVKIDQSFVREPLADENAHRIVTAVAGLGTAMGMSVIAEGVETPEQLSRIQHQGCSAAQGYFVSRPIPPRDIAAYLDAAQPQPGSPPPAPAPDTEEMLP